MKLFDFFDLPVYRLPKERYYREQSEFIESIWHRDINHISRQRRERDKADPYQSIWNHERFTHIYGGCWDYNEIIGYIKLHFLGTQVRGEYFAVNLQRIRRTRKKIIEYQTHKLAPEVEIARPYDRAAILLAIREYIKDCKREIPRRHIDTSRFDAIADYVDWESLYNSAPTSIETSIN